MERKEQKLGDDSSLIFCFDISGSMCQSYNVGKELKDKFNKILGKIPKKTIIKILKVMISIFQIMISTKIIQII